MGEVGPLLRKNLSILVGVFTLSVLALLVMVFTAPSHTNFPKFAHSIPRSTQDFLKLLEYIESQTEQHFFHSFFCFVALYLFLQTFAIPGSVWLSVLSGILFGKVAGFLIISVVCTFGASSCFLLSRLLAHDLVQYFFPERVQNIRNRLQSHSRHLFFYVLFLRVSPIVPNWAVNIITPICGLPLKDFFWGTFFGSIPANLLAISAGTTLHDLARGTGGVHLHQLLWLFFLSFAILIVPRLLIRTEEKIPLFGSKAKVKVDSPPLSSHSNHTPHTPISKKIGLD
eukprot:GCRY01004649.1.p1 GENE.GCRY01004649.1~~GCRY01004649.1.p1  ORF type:complete len:284 (+),score=30.13 GCRY01004649.1:186-1037(+)